MMIHLIMTPQQEALHNALKLAGEHDRFILLGDGATIANARAVAERGYFRLIDAQVRGLEKATCWNRLSPISDSDWVELTLSSDQVISWS